MYRLIAFVFALGFSAGALAAQPLLTPAELHGLLGDANVRVIDIRDGDAHAAQHIPGALSAPYGSWRGPASNPGELPPLPKLATRVQSLGLTPESHVVVVSSGADATDFGSAARVYWTLKVLGFTELSVLNGGVAAWQSAGLPQDSATVSVAASTYSPQLDTSLIATREEVANLAGNGKATLVDARPAPFFQGETRHQAARLPGTLKGAVNVTHATWFKPDTATFVSADEAKKLASGAALDPSRETVSFCNTGHWAATNWFALSEVAGQKNVKLYAGSMVDYTQDPNALPMDNVPNRAQQLVTDAKLWMARNFQ
jgi:thiosulfate/3-mercaptopyruvate sulfurtransferase